MREVRIQVTPNEHYEVLYMEDAVVMGKSVTKYLELVHHAIKSWLGLE